MPYVSQAQRRWAHTETGLKALGGASKVAEWDKASKGRKLPARKKRRKYVPPTKAQMIKEHEELVPILRSGNKKGLRREAKEQGEELRGLKKKAKLVVNNRLKGSFGAMNPRTNRIEINVKKHKGDKAELASTVKHEMMHVTHPKMTEKQVYKRTAKTKIPFAEQQKLLAKLRNKKLNYKMGATKRKLKMGRISTKPGELINKAKSMTRPRNIAMAGMV